MKKEKFDIIGMTCSSCVSHVETCVSKLKGVNDVSVNLLTNSMTVEFDDTLATEKIESAVQSIGYEAVVRANFTNNSKNNIPKIDLVFLEQQQLKARLWISFSFLLPLLYISMGSMIGLPIPNFFKGNENALIFTFTQFLLTLPIVFVNKNYFQNGFKALFKGMPNMDSLIAIGSSAAVFYGIFVIYRIAYALGNANILDIHHFVHDIYFESGATILTLITLGKYLESKSKSRTSNALKHLIEISPETAVVSRNNTEIEVPIDEVRVDDTIIVKPGQRIPVDGVVLNGITSVDESALTGESMPVYKSEGDTVLSASVNKSGSIVFRATKVGKDTTLSQIIQLVENASSSKAPVSKMADKVSSIFVPIVILTAIITTTVWLLFGYPFDFSLSFGIAVLVISCPCALGLATPVAIMVGVGKGAELGILFKSAESFEMASKINTIVLDKTGTLTDGKPKVTDVFCIDSITKDELIEIAGSLEKRSEHPLSEAILMEVEKRALKIQSVENFQSITGKGVEGQLNNRNYLVGNLNLMVERNKNWNEFSELWVQLAKDGKTPLFVADEENVIGIIAVADVLKTNSKEAVDRFKAMGLDVVMLTGDNAHTAATIQSQLGISTLISDVLPQDKDNVIATLQTKGKIVAMVGDGINDAPALMRSQLGIAVGSGTDIAVESADIVLMHSDLLDVVNAIMLSKNGLKIIMQNLFWAFFYNILGIPLAAGVFYAVLEWKLNPMFAAAAMSFSSITVVLNALRLLRFDPITYSKQLQSKQPVIAENIKEKLFAVHQNAVPVQIISAAKLSSQQLTSPKSKSFSIDKNKINGIMIEREIKIGGMTCGHCSNRVESALNSITGVKAKVDLESNSAKLIVTNNVTENTIKEAIQNAGYELISFK